MICIIRIKKRLKQEEAIRWKHLTRFLSLRKWRKMRAIELSKNSHAPKTPGLTVSLMIFQSFFRLSIRNCYHRNWRKLRIAGIRLFSRKYLNLKRNIQQEKPFRLFQCRMSYSRPSVSLIRYRSGQSPSRNIDMSHDLFYDIKG